MKRLRITYFTLTLTVIVLGLLVRAKQSWFPDFINLSLGDALYAAMIFYIYSFVIPKSKGVYRAIYALLTCYGIELLQLCQAGFLVWARTTLPGKLILGQGFLWSDILAYTIGITIVYSADRRLFREKKQTRNFNKP